VKRFEGKQREMVTERECVALECDLCGRKAEHLECEAWEWGGAGTASGKLEWQRSIDGEWSPHERDICYECAEALAEAMAGHRRELLKLIGRSEA